MSGLNLAKTLTATVVGIALAVAGTLSAEARSLDEIISSGTIRIATGTDFPPYDTVDKDMKPAGYDTDIANMIADDLGVKLELQVTIAGNRVSFLVTDKVDLVVYAFSATPERAKAVSFSHAYGTTFMGLYGQKSLNVASYDDLDGVVVGVDLGGTGDLTLTEKAPGGTKIVRFESNSLVHRAYKSGQVAAFVTSNTVAAELAKNDPDTEYDLKILMREDPIHIGVPRNNPDLLQWVNTFIYYHYLIGDLEALSWKWLREGLPRRLQEAP